jgi:hypothetical protein
MVPAKTNRDFPRQFTHPQRLSRMTQGERVFYLREIHGHWTTSTVSSEKLGELAEAKLIEVQVGHIGVVRLTTAGKHCKLSGRSHHATSLPLSRARTAKPRPVRRRDHTPKPRPLV